jgi:hypothetical protein
MNFFELLAKEMGTPVLCADGSVGMLVRYPNDESADGCAGVEIPGESQLHWVSWQDLLPAGDALRQRGSPAAPQSNWHHCPQEDTAMARRLLGELWMAQQPGNDAARPSDSSADLTGPKPAKG